MNAARLLIDSKSVLGEGAWFDFTGNMLYWLDIFGHEVHTLDAATSRDVCHTVPKPVTTIVPAITGGCVLGMADGVYRIDGALEGLRQLPGPDVDFAKCRCNDGKCDPQGRFWIGVMDLAGAKGKGTLYVMDGKTCEPALHGLDVPNGIVWNGAGDKVYFTDTLNAEIYAFDYRNGSLSNQRIVFKAETGMTDGMAIDEEDMVWVAVWGTGKVLRIDPAKGAVIDAVEAPAPQVSSVAVANGKIYITTARMGMGEEALARYPLSGGLFVADTRLRGVQSPKFMG